MREIKRRRLIMRRRRAAVLSFAVAGVLLAALLIADLTLERWDQKIRVDLGQSSMEVTGREEGEAVRFASKFEDPALLREAAAALCRTAEEEGIVLLRNAEGVLPLKAGARISVFCGSPALMTGPVSGGAYRADGDKDAFVKAMEEAGLDLNRSLWDYFVRGGGDSLPGKIRDTFADYPDAAVVVITRTGEREEGAQQRPTALTERERALLQLAGEASEQVIAVLNTPWPMEAGFLEEYGVDACLWTGALGETGVYGLASVLAGTVNPSGKLPDTCVFSADSAPSYANAQTGLISNSAHPAGNRYLVLAEGIYVGYRYYETRYEDVVTGAEAASAYSYAETVAYPFGYGLSYTDFTWSGVQCRETTEGWNVSVRVTNAGNTPGSEVVQVYLQRPFTEYDKESGIEKPSAELVGFARTGLLDAGESETVTVQLKGDMLDTYDSSTGKYIRETGEYYVTAARNAHHAVNNLLAAKGYAESGRISGTGMDLPQEQVQGDSRLAQALRSAALSESVRDAAGEGAVRLQEADLRTYDGSFRYLSRTDWTGTWPVYYADGNFKAPSSLMERLRAGQDSIRESASPVYNTAHGDTNLQLAELVGVGAEDYRWGWLMDQLSWRETYSYVRKAGGITGAVASCGIPETFGKTGAAGLEDADGKAAGMIYPAPAVLAASWDEKLVQRIGQLVGEDALADGTALWYTPVMNLHRLPAGSGNLSGFSEDSCLAGHMGAALTRGAREKGLIPVVGKLALTGDPEGEHGTLVMASEQSVRELYLEPLRYCVLNGRPGGVMTGTGRLGPRWYGGHEGLISGILRGEWSFDGVVTTDLLQPEDASCCDILEGLNAGTDLWRNMDNSAYTLRGAQLTYGVRTLFRNAVQRAVYMISQSSAMNGLTAQTRVGYRRPAWKTWGMIGSAAVILAAVLLIWFGAALVQRNRRTAAGRTGRGSAPGAGSAPRTGSAHGTGSAPGRRARQRSSRKKEQV